MQEIWNDGDVMWKRKPEFAAEKGEGLGVESS